MVGDAPESERPEPRDLYRKLVLLTGIRLLVGTALLVATALLSLGSEAFPGGIEAHLYAIIGGISGASCSVFCTRTWRPTCSRPPASST